MRSRLRDRIDARMLRTAFPMQTSGGRAVGAFALGAVAVGALAIGAVAIGRLAIGRARIRRMEIDELVVGRLRVTDEMQLPSGTRAEPKA